MVVRRAIPTWASVELRCEGEPELLFTENETNTRAAVGYAERHPLREGRLPRVRRGRPPRCGEPRPERARRPPRTTSSRSRRTRPRSFISACATAERARCGPDRVRRRVRRTHRRRRRVLRRRSPRRAPSAAEAAVMRQALAGMLWSKQLLLLRPRPVARRAQRPSASRRPGPRHPEPELVPHGERRRDLDARQMGVPLVRVVGPRLPHGRAWAWSTSTTPSHQLALMLRELYLHPERPAARLRVELQRRQPARSRLGDAPRLRDRARTARRGRRRPG